jgi:hypothetical protein
LESNLAFAGVWLTAVPSALAKDTQGCPAARDAIMLRRDFLEARILTVLRPVDFMDFDMYASLNRAVGEGERSFKTLDALHGRPKRRGEFARAIVEDLFSAKRYGDLVENGDSIIEELRNVKHTLNARDVSYLYFALLQQGQTERARRVADDAVAARPQPDTVAYLIEMAQRAGATTEVERLRSLSIPSTQ